MDNNNKNIFFNYNNNDYLLYQENFIIYIHIIILSIILFLYLFILQIHIKEHFYRKLFFKVNFIIIIFENLLTILLLIYLILIPSILDKANSYIEYI